MEKIIKRIAVEKEQNQSSKKKYMIVVGEWLPIYILTKDFDKAVQEIRYSNGEIFEWTEGDDLEELLANLQGWNNFTVIDEDRLKEINTRLQSILDNGEQILN